MQLSLKYRPINFQEVLAQDKIIKRIEISGRNGFGGNAYYLSGGSGTGKTTIALIIAGKVADPVCITEVVGRQLTPNYLKDLMFQWRSKPLFGTGYALICNESHGLTKPIIEIFLDILESLPDHVVIIFTTTNEGADLFEERMDSNPFDSRCIGLRLASRNLCQPFAERCKRIAELEGLNGKPLKSYVELMKQSRNNFRKVLQEIESGCMVE